jgi:hypothetical protein
LLTDEREHHEALKQVLEDKDGLEPARIELETEEALAAEYERERQKLFQHPDVLRELELNAQLPSVCQHPDAVVRIKLKDGFDKSKLDRRQYPMAQVKHEIIRRRVQEWLAKKWISRAPPNQVVNVPLLCAAKRDGEGNVLENDGRVCGDFRAVNLGTETTDNFPIPHIRTLFDAFHGKRLFAELDLADAFHQFLLHVDSREFTCFTWEGVQYWFEVMPFGIKFMTSFCQRFVSNCFRSGSEPLDFVEPYVDNLLFAASTWEELREKFVRVLQRCNQVGLRIKQKEGAMKVGHSHMRCLGHIVSAKGVSIDPKKLSCIADWPTPSTGEQVQSFLGLASFVRQHVRHYGDLSSPLEAIKQRKGKIEWTAELDQAFHALKRAIMKAPLLRYPDYARPFYVAADASNAGCGGVLYQPSSDEHEDVSPDNIVAICSRKWGDSQTRYSAYKKELYGLIYCLRKFHQYIWGRTDTVVYTDHKPLTYMFSCVELPVTLQQWMDHILDYSFVIRHRPGSLNVLADALSRMYEERYAESAWGVPTSLRFEGPGPSVDEAMEGFNAGAARLRSRPRIAESPAAEPAAPDPAISLLAEMERRGKRIPDEREREEFIEAEHALGHFGREAIFHKLHDEHNVWWPGMRQQIQQAIARCDSCARFVVQKAGFKPAQFIMAEGPWSHVQIDCSVHLPESEDGCKVLLVVVDVFSGFMLLYPIQSNTAQAVARKLWDAFTLFGFPRILQSDNGAEFVNNVVKALLKLMKVDERHIAPYNPRCDGKVERGIAVVMIVIKKLLQGADRLWPQFCPLAQLCVNNRISSVTRSTPFSLMFARDSHVLSGWDAEAETASLEQWLAFQERVRSVLWPAVNARVRQVKERMTQQVDGRHRVIGPHTFKAGDKVMLVDQKKTDKRQPKYVGPYIILRQSQTGNYVVKEAQEDGTVVDRQVPPDQLKLVDVDTAAVFEVERVVEHRGAGPELQYLVKWKNYSLRESPRGSHQETSWTRSA